MPRTLIIGFTQTRQWFDASPVFKSVAGREWALLYANGGGVDRWREPGFEGWVLPLLGANAPGFRAPERIILTISGPYGEDEAAWREAILASVANIRENYPSATQIVLQPIVG